MTPTFFNGTYRRLPGYLLRPRLPRLGTGTSPHGPGQGWGLGEGTSEGPDTGVGVPSTALTGPVLRDPTPFGTVTVETQIVCELQGATRHGPT